MAEMTTIRVTENPNSNPEINTVEVLHLGEKHSASWLDEEVLYDIEGDETVIRTAMGIWDGSEEMTIPSKEFDEQNQWK
ncbi:MAG: hypothetical protein WC708_01180 [Lentisphaeria bacterium]